MGKGKSCVRECAAEAADKMTEGKECLSEENCELKSSVDLILGSGHAFLPLETNLWTQPLTRDVTESMQGH